MNTLTDLIDRYIAAWNETDSGRRRDLIAATWTESATYLDPMLQGDGRDGIEMDLSVREGREGDRLALLPSGIRRDVSRGDPRTPRWPVRSGLHARPVAG